MVFLKLCLADRWGEYSDVIFSNTSNISSLSALTGGYAFSIQLYGDFLGYTLIALGSAKLFGINLSNNFKQPFLSKNIEMNFGKDGTYLLLAGYLITSIEV